MAIQMSMGSTPQQKPTEPPAPVTRTKKKSATPPSQQVDPASIQWPSINDNKPSQPAPPSDTGGSSAFGFDLSGGGDNAAKDDANASQSGGPSAFGFDLGGGGGNNEEPQDEDNDGVDMFANMDTTGSKDDNESSTMMTGYSATTYNDQQSNVAISSQATPSHTSTQISTSPPPIQQPREPVDVSVLGQLI